MVAHNSMGVANRLILTWHMVRSAKIYDPKKIANALYIVNHGLAHGQLQSYKSSKLTDPKLKFVCYFI